MERIGEDRTAVVEAVVRAEYVRLVRVVASVVRIVARGRGCRAGSARSCVGTNRGGEEFDHLAGWVVTVALNLTRNRFRQLRREAPLRGRTGGRF